MNEVSTSEKALIASYTNDFYLKTGKKIDCKILSKWESLCRLNAPIEAEELLELVLKGAGWTKEEVFDLTKKSAVVLKRKLVFYILNANHVTFKKLGKISGKDHSTTMAAIKSFEDELDTNRLCGKLLIETMNYIKETINSVTINH